MGLFGNRINPATGRPHRDDKVIGADRKGRARRKAEHDAWVAEQKAITRRLKQQAEARNRAASN